MSDVKMLNSAHAHAAKYEPTPQFPGVNIDAVHRKSFDLGRYTVRQGMRPDNPAFPIYLVYVGERLIGRQFSVPSLTDCQWLERNANAERPYSGGKPIKRRKFSTGGANSRNASLKPA